MKYWNLLQKKTDTPEELEARTGLPALVCRVLAARGVSAEKAQALVSQEEILFDPMLIKDMDKAAARMWQAVENGERIVVYGDYDCDGITSTALLTSYLETIGADVFPYIPDREVEGYGLNNEAIRFLREVRQAEVIVTVDNGVSALDEIDYANSLGMTVVVTDHHQPRETLPNAAAVVDPHRKDCESPFKNMAGVGVAFKLVCAMEGADGMEMMDYYGDLLTLGTIGDVMELAQDNRTFVRCGLPLIQQSQRPGLAALMEVAGVAGKPITSETVAFSLVPRLNAAGRMGDVYHALELLTTESEETAMELAQILDGYNRQRKEIEAEILQDVCAQLAADPSPLYRRAIVLAGHGWHHGVVGILCSRLVERFGKPCFLISIDDSGEGRASGRGVEGVSVIAAVSSCADLLTRYGGHPQAAGFSLREENIPAFTQRFLDFFDHEYETMPMGGVTVDCILSPQELTVEQIHSLDVLEPFGTGNEKPVFALRGLTLTGIHSLSGGKHLKLTLQGRGGASFQALWFFMSPDRFPCRPGDRVDLVADVGLSWYQGEEQLSVKIRDLRLSGGHQMDFFAGQARYERHLCGQESGLVPPTREEIGTVYRFLRTEKGYPYGCWSMAQRLRPLPFDKLMIALDVLEELELVKSTGLAYDRQYELLPVAGKVDLGRSRILAGLAEAAQ